MAKMTVNVDGKPVTMTETELQAYIAKLNAEAAAARQEANAAKAKAGTAAARTVGAVSVKIAQPRKAGSFNATDKGSAGGTVSVYGIQRMPISLYASQWIALAAALPTVRKVIKDNLNGPAGDSAVAVAVRSDDERQTVAEWLAEPIAIEAAIPTAKQTAAK